MTTYIDELKNKNKSLNKTIKDSKKELDKLKKELEGLQPQNISIDSSNEGTFLSIDNFRIESKTTLTEFSFPITIETKNKNIEITLEDIIKIRTLLDKKVWYKRAWEVIQKIWKKETKN